MSNEVFGDFKRNALHTLVTQFGHGAVPPIEEVAHLLKRLLGLTA